MYKTIVVGTDGSAQAMKAIEKGFSLAELTGANLHAITVINTRRYGEPALGSTELVLNELEERANEQLKAVEKQAAERGMNIVTDYFHGTPSVGITRYAETVDAELIVLGYQGRTHVGSRIGSTAERVIRETDRSVLLV